MDSFSPGMDPFLEDPTRWSDFHSRFINNWADALAEVLPERYSGLRPGDQAWAADLVRSAATTGKA
jgi:hypothetical protein